MNNILSIDKSTQTCIVESNVPMDALVDACLEHDLIPPIVPEYPGITVGGAFTGTAGESSSFKYGYFDSTVTWCEAILADGTVVRCSNTDGPYNDKADLFSGLKGTFGTLGIGVLFNLKLIAAARYVELTYTPISRGIEETKQVLKTFCTNSQTTKDNDDNNNNQIDYIDGIIFTRSTAIITTGKLTNSNSAGLPITTFHNPTDPWFYLHAQSILKTSLPKVTTSPTTPSTRPKPSITHAVSTHDPPYATPPYRELVPLKSYLFRYDRGAFWMGKYGFEYFLTPFTWASRYVFDSLMRTRVLYHALHRSGVGAEYLVQDVVLPFGGVTGFFNWICENIGLFPLWVCPILVPGSQSGGGLFNPRSLSRSANHDAGMDQKDTRELMLNIGLWGPCPHGSDPISINRALETKVKEANGMKWLYAQTFYTEDEFWSIYENRDAYQALRKKYGAEGLPDVFEKVSNGKGRKGEKGNGGVWNIWPLGGLYALGSVFLGGGGGLLEEEEWVGSEGLADL